MRLINHENGAVARFMLPTVDRFHEGRSRCQSRRPTFFSCPEVLLGSMNEFAMTMIQWLLVGLGQCSNYDS